MTLYFHKLTGCAPTPLAGYLKALGILRLVTEQADASARGAWRDESFVLATQLTAADLSDFFLTRYAPTPLVSPWNSGSGFLKDDNNVAPLLRKFESSPSSRLARYQQGAQAARVLCSELNAAKMEEVRIKGEAKILPKQQRDELRENSEYKARLAAAGRKLKRLKESFIPECRLQWRGSELEWLEAAIIINADGEAKYPALLGTGGNDGNLDFTDNFRQRFAELFDIGAPNAPATPNAASLLDATLFAKPAHGAGDYAIGQYAPGAAGGANSSNGLDGEANVNPWDFILSFEGSVLFAAAASRRLKSGQTGSGSAPFALMAQAAGHLSSSAGDKATRGEQWMPLWPRFATLREIRSLLGEGRAQLGRTSTREPLEMARSVARLGVARGVSAFERFAYLERNGQSNFAVPLGRWRVSAQPHQELLTDLDDWRVRLHREARSDHAANSLVIAVKNLDNAILAAAGNATPPLRWQNILLAIADLDAIAAQVPPDKFKAGILTSLRPGWIAAADDGSPEFRLALALAAQYGVRRHWLPLNKFGRLDENEQTSVVCFGRNFIADAIALLNRRLIESESDASRSLDQTPIRPELAADPRDIAAFLQGGLDYDRILRLALALMALSGNRLKEEKNIRLKRPTGAAPVDDVFILFRLCLAPRHWRIGIPVRADIFHRLAAGDITSAARLAAVHLRAHGVVPPIQTAAGDAKHLAAALAFPLSLFSRDALVRECSIHTTTTD